MTDRDVLKRASDALRESTEPSADEVLKLRQRLLGGGSVVPLARAQKQKAVRWVLPLAAAFIAGSALAATPGAWEGMLNSVERFLDVQLLAPSHEAKPAHTPQKQKPAPGAIAKSAEPNADALAVAEPAPAEPAPAEPVAEPVALANPSTRPRSRSVARTESASREAEPGVERDAQDAAAVAESASPEPSGPSRDVTMYKTAHQLHFGAQRYDEALRAWESYLALPSPTFTLEARYNRAFCLLKLGHLEEARAALRPFAEGRVLGSYRRDEASRLLQALDKRR